MARQTRSYSYVSVCGPVASGKTTLTKLLAARFGWSLLLEDLTTNLYLKDYYNDMHRWGFQTVMAFIIRGLTLQDGIAERLTYEAVCQDWYVAEHYATYGIHTFNEGIISERERQTCEELHRYLMAHQTKPDLLIVLTADPETLMSRAVKRQRPGEHAIPLGYIENLVALYDQWIRTLEVPHFAIDTTAEDLIHDSSAQIRLFRRVEALIG